MMQEMEQETSQTAEEAARQKRLEAQASRIEFFAGVLLVGLGGYFIVWGLMNRGVLGEALLRFLGVALLIVAAGGAGVLPGRRILTGFIFPWRALPCAGELPNIMFAYPFIIFGLGCFTIFASVIGVDSLPIEFVAGLLMLSAGSLFVGIVIAIIRGI